MKLSRLFLIMILAVSLMFVVACEAEEAAPGLEAGQENEEVTDKGEATENEVADIGVWSFAIEILTDDGIEEKVITNEDALAIGSKTAIAAMKDGDDVMPEEEWVGVLLIDVLEYLAIEDFTGVIVENDRGDSRDMELGRLDLDAAGFGWMVDGEMLDEDDGPIRFFNHNRGPKWWISDVSKVTVIK